MVPYQQTDDYTLPRERRAHGTGVADKGHGLQSPGGMDSPLSQP